MPISFIKLECPTCGASLSVEEGHKQIFCSYCGTKILTNNENEFIIRHIDEADVKRAEYEHVVKLKELELEERRLSENKKALNSKRKAKIVFALSFLCVAFVLIPLSKTEALGYLGIPGFLFFLFGILGLSDILVDAHRKNEEPNNSTQTSRQVNTTIVDNSVNIGLVNQRNYHVQANLNPKNKWVAFILCLFFGIFGAHKFYEGRPLLGVLYIFTVGLLGIGWLADLIILLSKPHIYYVK